MESAPLTLAHAHASQASHQTSLQNYKVAAKEHQNAAEEFKRAFSDTSDPEARRTLSLLQNHHSLLSSRLLASNLQTPPTPPPTQTTIPDKPSSPPKESGLPAPTTLSPPMSPGRTESSSSDEKVESTVSPTSPEEKPQMTLQPPTPTTPMTSWNPSHPSGTAKITQAPEPLPSPPLHAQTLSFPNYRGEQPLPSPNPFSLANELAAARGIRSPVRGRSPAAGNPNAVGHQKGFLSVEDQAPGGRRSNSAGSAGGTLRNTSPVLFNAPPKKKKAGGSGRSPVVAPREKLKFEELYGAGSESTQSVSATASATSSASDAEPKVGLADPPRGRKGKALPSPLMLSQRETGPIRPSVSEYNEPRRISPAPPQQTSAGSGNPNEAFDRFYSQFEKFINTASNPAVAFAGLPLDGGKVDINGPNESFYVVQPTGGTMSYAGIVRRDETTGKAATDKFESEAAISQASGVETVAADSAKLSTKTREELELENVQLRQLTDSLAKRLHAWEVTARENAGRMRESLALFKKEAAQVDSPTNVMMARHVSPQPPIKEEVAPSETSSTGPEHQSKIEALEAELAKLKVAHEKTQRDNEKLKTIVKKHRDRWEKLKEGAKSRRAEQDGSELAGLEDKEKPEKPEKGIGGGAVKVTVAGRDK